MRDFDDYEYEPTDEFAEKVRALVEDEARSKIKETFDSLEQERARTERLEKQLWEAQGKLRTYESDIEKARTEGVKEGERKFCCGFTVGDKVWYGKSDSSHSKCEKCEGKGSFPVTVFDKESKAQCPFCNGNGIIWTYNYTPAEDTVNSLKFWVSEVERGSPYKGAELKENWDIEVYLKQCDNHKNRKQLFKTREECQAYCDEKNASEAAKVPKQ